jgi:uncharacterized protein YllA (UPF0747 family)
VSEAVRLMSRSLAVRARVRPRPEPPLDRFHDPLIDDLTAGGPLSRERFATAWSDTDALRRLAESKRAPLPPALAAAMLDQHRRLGASPASLAGLERLARGEAVCAVAGQQPAPLGGPLYSLHKTAAAVGLASSIEARTGVRCVPMFWMHGEDSDFDEIRGATLADASLALHELALPGNAHREGELVGNLALDSLVALEREAVGLWSGLAGAQEVAALLERARGAARDLGEASAALMLRLFESAGLVVVDPRLPAFREAARPILDRYLANAEELSAQAHRAGALLQQRIGRQPLSEASLDSFVFAVDDGVRRKLSPEEARKRDRSLPLSPSVALRPAVQDGVFPTVAMACGPGEIAYLAQLREVFEGVGVLAACPVPRLSVTWLPPPAVELLESSGAEPASLIGNVDAVLRALAERQTPEPARAALARARAEAMHGLERLSETTRPVDASLAQLVESARGKIDFQYARLVEGIAGKVRQKLERQHPEWPRLRYYLMPGEKTQERRLASLEPVARRGAGVSEGLCELAREHAARLAEKCYEHLVVDL